VFICPDRGADCLHRWQICRCVASRATAAVPTVLVGLESRGRGSSVLGGFYCVSAGSSILSVSGVGRGRSVSGAGVCVGVCVCVASRADTDAELTLSKRTTRNERKVSIYTVSHKNRQKKLMAVTSSNVYPISEFFHRQIL